MKTKEFRNALVASFIKNVLGETPVKPKNVLNHAKIKEEQQ